MSYHVGLDQFRAELSNAENTLRRVMQNAELIRDLANGAAGFANIWRGLKQAQAEVDFLRVVLSIKEP